MIYYNYILCFSQISHTSSVSHITQKDSLKYKQCRRVASRACVDFVYFLCVLPYQVYHRYPFARL